MEYLFETADRNYEDFASGRVLYNARGTTAFPVRLASEIAQLCIGVLESRGASGPYSVYDPCCGGAYLLTVIGLLHGGRMNRIYASDSNPDVLGIAGKNLSLLTSEGLGGRRAELNKLIELYGKLSHRDAVASADRLGGLLAGSSIESVETFAADITRPGQVQELCRDLNLVITDLPYGDIASWTGDSADPVNDLFELAYERMEPSRSVLAIIADKSRKLKHDKFKRLQSARIGKRVFGIFEPIR
ncbi:hypothetical protein [Cohnella panacarvi]|uniref:hypothetical protein n=1 Tax=Cohnella panacarvi TaxID=400776 RepID=UPI000478DA92|nr:hypothetical protein [Cohnella panacarvi]